MTKRKETSRQTMIPNTLHKKLKTLCMVLASSLAKGYDPLY